MKIKRIIASEIAVLDSDVVNGGGTDVTEQLQAALDEALIYGGVHLVMDGAALVRSLKIHSNTTIECLSLSCGFYQVGGTDNAIIGNYNENLPETVRTTPLRNVRILGGTYNQNCREQKHHTPIDPSSPNANLFPPDHDYGHPTFGMEFWGVENLTVRDVHMVDFRSYAFQLSGFKNVVFENVRLELPNKMQGQNQDGIHFSGPGSNVSLKNISGDAGDDFIAFSSDDYFPGAPITDVLVDGVFLEEADQAVRLYSCKDGRLDRITIRNVTGVYRSFGFYINCWFQKGGYGNFGNIVFENIDLRAVDPNFTYRKPMLFSIGGDIECLTFRNVTNHLPHDNRTLFEIGSPFHEYMKVLPEDNKPRIGAVIIDGLTVFENDGAAADAEYIKIFDTVDRLILRDVFAIHGDGERKGHLISFVKDGNIRTLMMNNVMTAGFASLVSEPQRVGRVISDGVRTE